MSPSVRAETTASKNGDEVKACVNAEPGQLEQEMRLAEPYPWDTEFQPEAEKPGTMEKMGSMKSFDVHDEIPTAQCSQE